MSECIEEKRPEIDQDAKTHKSINLQHTFLNIVRKEHIAITVFLTN